MNGRGIPAQGPLPPGIFGHVEGETGINRVVYEWRDGAPRRRSAEEAKRLIAEAGWPNGRDAKSGEPLVLNLDTTAGGMGDKSRLDWLTRQFAKIDVQLVVRATDFNRFQEKLRKGAVQLYFLGWNADYPDPENFLFLLHGREGGVDKGGENKSNYRNPEFDRLFAEMKNMENSPRRLEIIGRMNRILHEDAPWIYAFHPKSYTLGHAWLKNRKPSDVGNNSLKYQRLDATLREAKRAEWNRPVLWPLVAVFVLLAGVLVPAAIGYRRRERALAQ
jgi:ABC-type transport system substrate-binding protein